MDLYKLAFLMALLFNFLFLTFLKAQMEFKLDNQAIYKSSLEMLSLYNLQVVATN
jgi:hypothetical protein